MANEIINGSDLMVFVDNKSIALATSHSLSISAETVDTSNKGLTDHTNFYYCRFKEQTGMKAASNRPH